MIQPINYKGSTVNLQTILTNMHITCIVKKVTSKIASTIVGNHATIYLKICKK